MSSLSFRITPYLPLLLLLAGAPARALQDNQAFSGAPESLPDLGLAPQVDDDAKHFAEMAKKFGEASMSDNGLTTSEQARVFAIGKLGNEVSHQLENWLSPWGNANVDLLVDKEGNFTGSKGSWFVPLQDNGDYLTESVLGHPAGYGSGRQYWSRPALADGLLAAGLQLFLR